MAFVAECVFCGHHVRVPSDAFGGLGRCPNCSSYFTLAPVSEPSNATSLHEPQLPRAPARVASAPPFSRTATEGPANVSSSPQAPGSGITALSGADVIVTSRRARPEPQAFRFLGLACLLVSAAALLCAFFVSLSVLVVPLAVLGLILGLTGLFLARKDGEQSLRLPAAASILAGGILLTVLWFPKLLDFSRGSSRTAHIPPPTPGPGGPRGPSFR